MSYGNFMIDLTPQKNVSQECLQFYLDKHDSEMAKRISHLKPFTYTVDYTWII